jgi:predicted dehydrogenase
MTMKAAVIGCGGAGVHHARGYATSPHTQLAAVCDLDAARAEAAAKVHGVKAYTDLEAMLRDVRPGVVSVATRETHHGEPVLAALRAGCHVFCEKIMAGSVAEGRRMVEAAAEAGRVLGVNYNYRHFGVFRRLRRMLDDGSLGEPMALICTTHRFCWHHVLDLSRFLLGRATAMQGEVTDDAKLAVGFWPDATELLYIPRQLATASIAFAGGSAAVITSSGHQPFDFSLIDLRLVGTKGTVDVQRINVGDLVGRVETSANVTWPGPLDGPRTLDDSFVTSLHAFLDALAAGRPVPTDGGDGLAVMGMEHAVVRAARTGQRVALAAP